MSSPVIAVSGLGKRYRLGAKRQQYGSLRESLSGAAAGVWQGLKNLASGAAPGSGPEEFWALKDVSFEVERGEVVGIIGRNGAGKSTLLKVLSRIVEPTEGRAELHGRVGSLLEVGTGFHPELTGRENIYMSGAILGMKKAEIDRKFDEIVAFADIEKFLDTPCKRYSSGMYVRLGFAVAAHLEPEILIVDEVLAVGDAAFQKKCLGKMSEVSKGGRTVLFVSHNMNAVLNLCGRGLLLDAGRVEQEGSSDRVVSAYMHAIPYQPGSTADLRNHPGRGVGTGAVLVSAMVRGSEGSPGGPGLVVTGEDLVFEIEYDTGELVLDYAMIGICSSLGERVLTVGTHQYPEFAARMQGHGRLECRIPALPLVEGEYSAMLAIGTRNPNCNVDCVEDALQFRVELRDFFGTGATLLCGQGPVAQRSSWRAL